MDSWQKIDQNSRGSLTAVSSIDFETIVRLVADPITGRLLVDSSGGSSLTIFSETPSGAIDGSNVTYTVLNTITTVLTFGINGQLLQPDTATQTNDFSTSGNTITLHTPLDASLSGRPFTIVYTGVGTPVTGVGIETPSGNVDGSNLTFTTVNTPLYAIIDNYVRFNGFGYTFSGTTLSVDPLDPPTSYIRTVYSNIGTTFETPTGVVNGSNTSFSVVNAPLYVIIDGITAVSGFGYTFTGGVITVNPLAPPVEYIRSVYSVGSGGVETPTGTVNGSNTNFTVVNTPQYIIVDEVILFSGFGYTYGGGTISVDPLVTPQNFIRSIY